MKNLEFDRWVAAHASQFKLHNKHKENDPYNPEIFRDKTGFISSINKIEKEFKEKIKKGYKPI